jgi:hypothetical protein
MTGINDVDQKIGQQRFFERGPKALHQIMRRPTHEPHRIGQQELLPVGQ